MHYSFETLGETEKRFQRNSVYYFLQAHVNLQLSQNKQFNLNKITKSPFVNKEVFKSCFNGLNNNSSYTWPVFTSPHTAVTVCAPFGPQFYKGYLCI